MLASTRHTSIEFALENSETDTKCGMRVSAALTASNKHISIMNSTKLVCKPDEATEQQHALVDSLSSLRQVLAQHVQLIHTLLVCIWGKAL